MEMEKYDLIKMIGSGSYGVVYEAKEKATNRNIAVKLINKVCFQKKEQKKFLKECEIHNSLSHPNIIQMLCSFETIEYIVVVTELAGIDLHRFMAHNRLSEKQAQKLTWNLLSALFYLHSNRVLHRDLKPQNILLNNYQNMDEIEAKLCDFGLARKMNMQTYLLTSVKGTPLYMAPEVMCGCYDQRADLWSVGCIIYEAHFRKPPIKTNDFTQLMKWLRNPEIVWPSPISETSKSFLIGLLQKEPSNRLTWPQILKHSYVENNLIIVLSDSERPLTEDLTSSQQIQKEKQRDEIILNRSKKIITDAMSKCHATKPKINQNIVPQSNRKQSNVIGDNESVSSDDSINAIIQTDIETDVDCSSMKRQTKLIAESEKNQHQNLIIKRYTDNFIAIEDVAADREERDNANLKIGTMLENIENIEKMQLGDDNKWLLTRAKTSLPNGLQIDNGDQNCSVIKLVSSSNQLNINSDLEKRKLSQNLENFSIRLSHDMVEKINDENEKHVSKEKEQCVTDKSAPKISIDTKQEFEDDQSPTLENDEFSPTIENEEWIAFIRTSMQEILNGETDSLKDTNFIFMIVAILRNCNASITVIGNIVQLLSIPFVLPITSDDITQIKTIYLQTKLLPNLLYASRNICMVKSDDPSFSSTLSSSNLATFNMAQKQVVFKKMSELTMNQLKTLIGIYELSVYLVHLNEDFLAHFCDSMEFIHNYNELLRHLLSDVVYDLQGMQLVCAIVSILCFVLREAPEKVKLVNSVIFHDSVDVIGLLHNGNILLRIRLCHLLEIVGRFMCSSLQKVWTKEFKQTLESLLDGENAQVKEAAKGVLDELSHLTFFNI